MTNDTLLRCFTCLNDCVINKNLADVHWEMPFNILGKSDTRLNDILGRFRKFVLHIVREKICRVNEIKFMLKI